MSNIKSLTNILPLAIILLGLVSYNFMSAAWTPAPATPPANNAAAPINVGTSTQSFQSAHGQLTFDRVNALTQMRSQEYCDLSGNVCKSAASLLGPLPSGTGLGEGQSWQDMKSVRTYNTTYQNTTGRAIMVSVVSGGSNQPIIVSTDGVNWVGVGVSGNYYAGNAGFIVPNGHYYRVDGVPYGGVPQWSELR